jgi:hypothetical protein
MKCEKCGKEVVHLFTCSHCGEGFCDEHKLPESHECNKRQEFIKDARNSLLAHYSSKSTNQTAVLLGLAVAFFADVQVALNISLKWAKIAFLVYSVTLIVLIGIRAIGRLIMYGELASGVTQTRLATTNVTNDRLREKFPGNKNNKPDDFNRNKEMVKHILEKFNPPEWSKSFDLEMEQFDVEPTYLARLAVSAELFTTKILTKKHGIRSLVLQFDYANAYVKYAICLIIATYSGFWWWWFSVHGLI